jgi:hypothetical protein
LGCKQLLPKKIENPNPTATLHPSTIFFFFRCTLQFYNPKSKLLKTRPKLIILLRKFKVHAHAHTIPSITMDICTMKQIEKNNKIRGKFRLLFSPQLGGGLESHPQKIGLKAGKKS